MKNALADPRHEMALLHRVLIGSAVFFVLLLIGVQLSRSAGVLAPAGSSISRPVPPNSSPR